MRPEVSLYLSRLDPALGGIVRTALDTAELLARNGHLVKVLTRAAGRPSPPWLTANRNLSLVEVSASDLLRPSVLARHLGNTAVLHLHSPWDPWNLALAKCARRLGIPYVVSLHGTLDTWSMNQKRLKKLIYLTLAKPQMLTGAALIHCTARAELDQASKYLPTNQFCVAPCAVDLTRFLELGGRCRMAQSIPNILYLGRLHPKKGVHVLLEAVSALSRRSDFTITIAGPCHDSQYKRKLLALASRHELGGRVRFLGMVTGEEKVSAYAAASIFALPTSQENFGLTLVEAMACGLPLITTRGVDIWQELQAGGARICEPTPDSFAKELLCLLDHAEERERLGAQGAAFVRSWLCDEGVYSAYSEMYRIAMQSRHEPA